MVESVSSVGSVQTGSVRTEKWHDKKIISLVIILI